jgi:hypothetical protein
MCLPSNLSVFMMAYSPILSRGHGHGVRHYGHDDNDDNDRDDLNSHDNGPGHGNKLLLKAFSVSVKVSAKEF